MAHSSDMAQVRLETVQATSTDFLNDTVKRYFNNDSFPQELISSDSDQELANRLCELPRFSKNYRLELANEIASQYSRAGIELDKQSEVFRNIERLKDENTVTVTTGQQIHIFLGPLFVVNKILSCCAETQELQLRLPKHQVVPVFWLASEDHDFNEIRSARLYNELYTWDIDSNGPVGRLDPKSILPLVEAAKERIDQTEENLAFLEVCQEAYSHCSTFSDATRRILHTYFEETGIVILDADSHFLKSQLRQNIEQDLFHHDNSSAIKQTNSTLKNNKIKPPINTRPINYFMISDTNRNRIEESENGFHLVGSDQNFTEQEIRDLIQKAPESFSPNALIRPVYQQLILPNWAYVCGGSEFIYWLELKDATEHAGAVYPRLIIRKSAFFMSQRNASILEDNDVSFDTLFFNDERFTHVQVSRMNKDYKLVNNQVDSIRTQIGDLITELETRQKQPINRLKKASNKLQELFKNEIERTFSNNTRDDTAITRLMKIKNKVWSSGYVQERNKDIISSLTEVNLAVKMFKNDYTTFANSREISLLIK
ncbi:MAG: bacillithiol biosynthesis cysteine-adding enzyme BshC [Bacteroidia bacterium]|nr:bacillithiol biosynthesis cysteine-adding enzyme BshC [Bacteroidia bacterium]